MTHNHGIIGESSETNSNKSFGSAFISHRMTPRLCRKRILNRRQEYFLVFQIASGATLAVAIEMLSACSAPPHERVVTTATAVERSAVVTLRPPALREESVPAAPSARVAWQAGHWSWNGTGYIWIAGHYVDRPYANAVWEPGHWVDHGTGWVWDEGHWRA
jgi:hypothetical protein